MNDAIGVKIEGGGTLYGNAERMWQNFSDIDDRMSPYGDDGDNSFRTHLIWVKNSKEVEVRDLKLHNSSDWNFKLDSSRDIW